MITFTTTTTTLEPLETMRNAEKEDFISRYLMVSEECPSFLFSIPLLPATLVGGGGQNLSFYCLLPRNVKTRIKLKNDTREILFRRRQQKNIQPIGKGRNRTARDNFFKNKGKRREISKQRERKRERETNWLAVSGQRRKLKRPSQGDQWSQAFAVNKEQVTAKWLGTWVGSNQPSSASQFQLKPNPI